MGESKLEQATTAMMEHVCDHLCRFPGQCSEEELEEICAECRMDGFIGEILNS